MQILTKEQVKYRRVVTKRGAVLDYCLGISFQEKLFVSDKFFAGDRQKQAIDYCQNRYLADGGKRSYILLANMAGLTVWQEDKIAQIVGIKSPEDFISDLELDSSIAQVQNIAKILIGDRHSSPKTDNLINSLEISLQAAVNLAQKLIAGHWFESVENGKPFENIHCDTQFYWD